MHIYTPKKVTRYTLPFLLGAIFLTHAAHAVTITDLGSLGEQATDHGEGQRVSSDGSVIVGYSGTGYTDHVFKWTAGGRMVDLGALGSNPAGANPSHFSNVTTISSDGSVITGRSANGEATQAFKWTVGGGMVGLGAFGPSTNPLANNTHESRVVCASTNGSVIAGVSDGGTGWRPFIYTDSTGMVGLGVLGTNPTAYGDVRGMSSDGTVIIGYSYNDTVDRAYKWTAGTGPGAGMVDLGALGSNSAGANPANYSYAYAISADGNVIAGDSYTGTTDHAFRYTSGGGMVDLGNLGTSVNNVSNVYTVSSNGGVIIGTSYNDVTTHAFKWTEGTSPGTGMVDLGALGSNPNGANPANDSYARAVSADGNVIAGYSWNGTTSHAFKYTDSTGIVDLGALGSGTSPLENTANLSAANFISSDGTVIVGESNNGSADRVFRYTDSTGMVDLGALGTNPANYAYARGISSDGSMIVGYARNDNRVERAVLWADNRGVVDVVDWMSSITGANSVSSMSNNLDMTFVEGAHHRTMMSYDNMGKQNQVWVTGDFGSSSRTTNSNITTGEVGVSTTLAEGIVGGIAAGYGAQNTDLQFDGSAAIKGNFILGELDYLLPDKQSIFSVLVAYGKWSADTHRGYTVGGPTPDYSNGTTDTTTSTVRLRLDGQKYPINLNVSVTPFASMSWTQTKADAYAETGGAYPALFDAQSHTASEGRLGLVASYQWSENTKLMASAELIHRFDDKATMLTGTDITGAMPFATSSAAPIVNQARFGFDVDRRLDATTLLNFSVHFAGLGASPDVQGALSLRRAF